MDDTLADLNYIQSYAATIRQQIERGEKPTVGFVNRMAELADKVQKTFDPELEQWCNDAESRRGNGSC
jgi:hypothetical protein